MNWCVFHRELEPLVSLSEKTLLPQSGRRAGGAGTVPTPEHCTDKDWRTRRRPLSVVRIRGPSWPYCSVFYKIMSDLFVFDFDHTLINVNSDPFVISSLSEKGMQVMKELQATAPWPDVMDGWSDIFCL